MGLLHHYISTMVLRDRERQARASPRPSRRFDEGTRPYTRHSVNKRWHPAHEKEKQSHLNDSQRSFRERDCVSHTACQHREKQSSSEGLSDYEHAGFNCATETRENMALNAVMMSAPAGLGSKRSSSIRHIPDADSDEPREHVCNPSSDSAVSSTRSDSSTPNGSKCACEGLQSKQTVVINVGGQVFETYRFTLRRLKSCKLASDSEMAKYYRVETGDYFFDRDPFAFNIILNYLRYGDLHLPTNLCGPALMREFEFWGIDEQDIERCCFQPYNTWKTQTKSLEKLEYDRKQSTTQKDLAQDRQSKNCWRRIRAIVWTYLQDPNSSTSAKVYAYISVIFVALSIFSFCAETHPFFQISPDDVTGNLIILYRIFTLEDSAILKDSKNQAVRNISSDSFNGTAVSGDDELTVQHPVLLITDILCVFFFSVEFLTRLVFCPKKFRFCTSLQNIIDFVAIVPDYVEFIILSIGPGRHGLPFVDFIFILRMLRLCRIFRLIRHVPGLWILLYTLKASFNELMLMFVFLLIGMVMFASLLHFIEGGKTFSNIPVGFWWAVVTMTTVGYGDMVPVTGFGYIIGSICAISGLLMIAFTVPIIVSNFVLYYTHVQYGISDREYENGIKVHENYGETESCSYHTTYTDTSEDHLARTTGKTVTNSPKSNTSSLRHSITSSLKSNMQSNTIDEEPSVTPKPTSGSKEQVVFVISD